MRISTDDIPARGLPVSADLTAPWLSEAARLACEDGVETLTVALTVDKDGERVVVEGEAEAVLPGTCARCLSAVRLTIGGPVALRYAPIDPDDATDRDLNADDLDEGWFDGRLLDMTSVVSEQLTLWMPERVLCDSPGVERLTEGSCRAIEYNTGPEVKRASPFAGLKLPNK